MAHDRSRPDGHGHGRGHRLTGLALALALTACTGGAALESRNVGSAQQLPVRGTSYYLPKKLLNVQVWGQEVELVEKDADGKETTKTKLAYFAVHATDGSDERLLPDLRHQFVVVQNHDVGSDDYLEVTLSSDGLLDEVFSHTRDERGDAARGIADLLSMVVAGPGAKSKWKPSAHAAPTRGLGGGEPTSQPPQAVAVFEFDPIDPTDVQRVTRALKKRYDIDLLLTKQSNCPTASSGAGCCTTCDATQPGIYYRLPLPYRLSLSHAGVRDEKGEWEILEDGIEHTVLLPNESLCLVAPVNRAAFVTSRTIVDFDRGMLTKVTTDKPSELLGFVRIPVDVVGAILAIPAELLTIRIHREELQKGAALRRKATAEAKKAEIEAQLKALQAQQDVRRTKAEGWSPK